MDHFDLKKFLVENKLTPSSLKEQDDDFNVTPNEEWNLSPEEESLITLGFLSKNDWTKQDGWFIVGGYLDLRGTKITELPPNLKVKGYLDLTNTPITELPPNLKVKGSLYLTNTPITELPPNLKVGSSLYLRGTKITELPPNLQVGGQIFGFKAK